MEVLYVTHPLFAAHETGKWHPERPARLEAVERGLRTSGVAIRAVEAPPVEREVLELVHDSGYIDALQRFVEAGGGSLDPDTVAGVSSFAAAMRAAGAGPAAVESLRDCRDVTAYLAVRPPGHHALRDRAMGFCLFNNVAVTAAWLKGQGSRVAIVDWDVHHGNGTQARFAADPDVLYLSAHQWPFYPGEGSLDETGVDSGEGTVLNAPFPARTAGDVYRELFSRVVVPVLKEFSPDWILVSSGYDAHDQDPLAELRLVASDYGVMAAALVSVVPAHRVIVFLEGGYHLQAITASVAETVRGLSGGSAGSVDALRSPPASWKVLDHVVATAARFWPVS